MSASGVLTEARRLLVRSGLTGGNEAKRAGKIRCCREGHVSIGERVLLALSREPGTGFYSGATEKYTLRNALDFAKRTIPNFEHHVRERAVLDFGCGPGWQAVALSLMGAKRVFGLDIREDWAEHGRKLALDAGVEQIATFGTDIRTLVTESVDTTFSLNSFEHFAEPERMLQLMAGATRDGGSVIVSFAEPWLSPHGSHMDGFTRVPWVNVLFSERTVMNVRSRFRNDGATHYEEVKGGLNRMTLRRFERIVKHVGLRIEYLRYYPVNGLPLVSRIPGVREFLVSSACCVMRKL